MTKGVRGSAALIQHGTENCYVNRACRRPECRKAGARARKLRTLRTKSQATPLTVPAIGSIRRLQALMCVGWSIPALERQAGALPWKLHNILYRAPGTRVERSTAELVSSLYDSLWDREPQQTNKGERISVKDARAAARKNGWLPPMAWYGIDMDDPDSVPCLDADIPEAEMFDWVKVERAAGGWLAPQELSSDERYAAAKILVRRGMSINAASDRMGIRAETYRKREPLAA